MKREVKGQNVISSVMKTEKLRGAESILKKQKSELCRVDMRRKPHTPRSGKTQGRERNEPRAHRGGDPTRG